MEVLNGMNLELLREPFPATDVEWRVQRVGTGPKGLYCVVIPYITARAIQSRLDDVCGPANWMLEEPTVVQCGGTSAFACGISIQVGEEGHWITKWDVCEPTAIEAAKGGWSGAMKRAGAQWGIGRYLYHLNEVFAEVAEKKGGPSWNYAKHKEQGVYYWKTPDLPGWALPKEPEHAVSESQLSEIKSRWRQVFMPGCVNPAELRSGFERFAHGVVGAFPVADHTCWTSDAFEQCQQRIDAGPNTDGIDADVPFEG